MKRIAFYTLVAVLSPFFFLGLAVSVAWTWAGFGWDYAEEFDK